MAFMDSTKLNRMTEASNLSEIPEADRGTIPSADASQSRAIPIFGFVNTDCFPDYFLNGLGLSEIRAEKSLFCPVANQNLALEV
jgi:hypothetical protein